jgi:hypothetical protein
VVRGERISLIVALLVALAGVILAMIAYFPGYMSPDSIWQLAQGRSRIFDDTHPPLMALIWGALDKLWRGPAPMVLLQNVLFWGGLAGFSVWLTPQRAPIVMGLIGYWPPVFALLGTVWKDVQMGAALMSALALILLTDKVIGSHARRIMALSAYAALIYATAMRHNGVLAAFPLLVLLVARTPSLTGSRPRSRIAALCAAAVVMVLLVGATNQALTARHSYLWQQSMVYDLAAISLADGRDEFPPSLWQGKPPISQERLSELYDPGESGALYFPLKPGRHFEFVSSERGEPMPDPLKELPRAWATAIFRHPIAFARHRWRLTRNLLGIGTEYVCIAYWEGITENDLGVTLHQSAMNRGVMAALRFLRNTVLFRGWVYVLVLLSLSVVAMLRRGDLMPVSLAVGASGLLNSLPHLIVGVGCDFRYLWWSVICALCLLAIVVVDVARRGYRLSLPNGASL